LISLFIVSGGTINERIIGTTVDDSNERNFTYFAVLLAFLIKVLSFFRILNYTKERRSDDMHPLDTLNPTPDSIPNPTVETINENHILPCLERLQRLETLYSEIKCKPAQIPLEKERILVESWDRIKSIESDLERTKKVSLYFIHQVPKI